MRLEKLLRILILCEVVLAVALVVESEVGQSLLPEALRSYVLQDQNRELTTHDWLLLPFGIAMVLSLVIGWVALWRLRPLGRLLYAIAWVISIALTPFLGPTVDSWLGQTITELGNTASALILGLVFFSDIRWRFQRKPKRQRA